MKKFCLLAATAAVLALTSFSAYAGEWKQNDSGWWYDNGDNTYAQNGWTWIDGRCYYFTPEGYCLTNTTTPDGYQVGAGGEWIVDGIVQVQNSGEAANTYQIGDLTVSFADTFTLKTQEATGCSFASQDPAVFLTIDQVPLDYNFSALPVQEIEASLDKSMKTSLVNYTSKSRVQLTSGVWYRYDYSSTGLPGDSGTMTRYTRPNGYSVQMILFMGDLSGMDTDAILNGALK